MDNLTIKEGFVGQRMIVLPKAVKKKADGNPISRSFYVTDIGYYPRAENHFRERQNGANEYVFIYCTEGVGWLELNGQYRKIHTNQFFMMPKGETHRYGASKDNPWSIYWMHFEGTMAKDLFARYKMNISPNDIIPFENERIELFDQMYKIFQSNYIESSLEYVNILSLNFIGAFIYGEIHRSTDAHARDNLVDAIIGYLTDNLDKSFTSQDIADAFNYSTSYLFSLFKKRTGYAIIHFFNLKKTQKACEYLKYTDMSVKEISFSMGFQDPLYFSRLFKKNMGMSPRAYKNSQRF
ncbi:transcriptional regulator, AraC family [Pricia antarctica]|uniref:Transcriptional regulator, AraC family n=1 Tax=Pricia antarctica TaxID=641691 RepID=A0A1G6XWM2_9FLAO|nr:AraC family transcriptional regulator [Pricia antarctica]SDD82510.1 transcriptional regulator, AraC family [Pricia antarctica]